MTNPTPLAKALDRLSSEKQDKMARVMEVAEILLTGVFFDRKFVAGQAKKHSGPHLKRAMLAVGAWHLAQLEDGTGLKDWSTALAKELNGKLEETPELKAKPTETQEAVIQGLMHQRFLRDEAERVVLSLPVTLPTQAMMVAALKRLDAERAS